MAELSTIVRVQSLKGRYTFRVEHYEGLSTQIGVPIESPEFVLCGNTWSLNIYPGGENKSHAGYIACYLQNRSMSSVRASYTFTIVGPDNIRVMWGPSVVRLFGSRPDGWGLKKFIPSLKTRGTVTFIVDIVVYIQEWTIISEPSLARMMAGLFNDETSSDVKVMVKQSPETLHLHRCILMHRSEVFRRMLRSNMHEATTGTILIADMTPAALRAMMWFFYTDQLPSEAVLQDTAIDLLYASKNYLVPTLQHHCESYLSAQPMSLDMAIPMLVTAELTESAKLKNHVLKYIAAHFRQLVKTREYQALDDSLKEDVETIVSPRGCLTC